MGKYILKRLGYALIVMLVASLVAFFLVRLAPGDPAELILGDSATDEQLAMLRAQMGLDKPIIVQYGMYLNNIMHGDLGSSTAYKQPCLTLIKARLGYTLELALAASILIIIVSVPLGVIAGVKKGSFADFFSVFFALLGQSLSAIWVGTILILVFGVKLRWLPTQGYEEFKNLILPAITLGLGLMASTTRLMRSGMYLTLQEDYITATYARGISKFKVVSKYALKNAILPVITVFGTQFAAMLGGSVVTESVFGWPGIGSLLLKSIQVRDYQLTQSILLFTCLALVVINLIIDLLYSIIDPRVHLEG